MTNKNYDFASGFDAGGESVDEITQTDAAIFGELRGKGARVVAKPTPLSQITFDLAQPRRVLPNAVMGSFDGSPAGVGDLFRRWFDRVKPLIGRDSRLDVLAVVRGDDYVDMDTETAHPLVKSLIDLIELAVNIRDEGLNNPVTVSKQGRNDYLLHSGERRTMAYHLLAEAMPGEKKWQSIPAIETEHSVWSQTAENTQRSEMNAVSMTRALANLIMDMYTGEVEFVNILTMKRQHDGCDRPYYAQIIEMDLSIKRGMGEKVMNALNTTNRGRVSQYRKILTLTNEAWIACDENNIPERRIRDLLEMPAEMQIKAAQQDWQQAQIDDYLRPTPPQDEGRMFTTVNTTYPDFDQKTPESGENKAGVGNYRPYVPPAPRQEKTYGLNRDDHFKGRPMLTADSPDDHFAMYEFAPSREELREDGIAWGEAEEWIMAVGDAQNIALGADDYDPDELDDAIDVDERKPISEAMVKGGVYLSNVLGAMERVASALNMPKHSRDLHMLKVRSVQSIRQAVDTSSYKDYAQSLDAEWHQVIEVLRLAEDRVRELMTLFDEKAREVDDGHVE